MNKDKVLSVIIAAAGATGSVAAALQDADIEVETDESTGSTTVSVGPSQETRSLIAGAIGAGAGFLAGGPPGAIAGAVAGYAIPIIQEKV